MEQIKIFCNNVIHSLSGDRSSIKLGLCQMVFHLNILKVR